MNKEFSDSIEENIELLNAMMSGQTRECGNRAHHAALQVEKAVMAILDQNKADSMLPLGVTCAVFKIARIMIQAKQNESLIQLLN